MHSSGQVRAHAALVWSLVLYGTGPVLISATGLPGPIYAFWRMLLALPVLALLSLPLMRGRRHVDWRSSFGAAAVAAGLGLACNQMLFMGALHRITVVEVTLVGTLSPVMTGLLAAVLLGERLRPTFWAWFAVAMAGVVVVIRGGLRGGGSGMDPAGLGLAVGSTAAFAMFLVAAKSVRSTADPTLFTFGATCFGALSVTAYITASGSDVGLPGARELVLVLGVVIGGGSLAHILFVASLRQLSVTFGAVARLSLPFIAGALAWFFLDEPIGLRYLFGGAIILLGVGGAARASRGSPDQAVAPT